MAKSVFDAPQFKSEAGAFRYVEEHLWPRGPVCPHCGCMDRIGELKGKSTRLGLRKCYDCKKPFTVRMGTIFESSHLPLHLWLQVIHLMCASKKGISTRQIQRMLSCSMKTAWFLTHRIREAMRSGDLDVPFGSGGGAVEVDETYFGIKEGRTRHTGGGHGHKFGVLSLVDRDTGQSRWFTFDKFSKAEVHPLIRANIAREARLMTDEHTMYQRIGKEFAEHGTTLHRAKQYVDLSDRTIHTNTVEGAFSIFKRGMKGVYQHCAERHLHRYLAEFEFRYNNRAKLEISDTVRADILLRSFVGKRLTYETAGAA